MHHENTASFPQLPHKNLPPNPAHFLSFYHAVLITYSATTTDVSVGTALNIPWWKLCIFSALISLTADMSWLNYSDINKQNKNGRLDRYSVLILFLTSVSNNLLMVPPYINNVSSMQKEERKE